MLLYCIGFLRSLMISEVNSVVCIIQAQASRTLWVQMAGAMISNAALQIVAITNTARHVR